MEVIEDVKVDSPLPAVKVELASPEHEVHSLEVSTAEERLAPVKYEDRCASEELVCLQEGLPHIKDEVIVKDEIEIGPTVIQARKPSTVELAGISDAEFIGNYSLTENIQDQINVVECNSGTVMYKRLSELTTPVNQASILYIRNYTEEKLEKLFSCNLCNYNTIYKSNLTKHIRSHTEDKLFSCYLCNYKTTQQFLLTMHIRTHSGDKPFSCHLCNYKATQKSNLTKHIRTHSGDKPFSCDLCNYKATEKSSLTRHNRTHSGDRPFSCHLCNYKATQKSSLTKHIRTHSGDKPFSCQLCNYKATQQSHLTRHIRTHS